MLASRRPPIAARPRTRAGCGGDSTWPLGLVSKARVLFSRRADYRSRYPGARVAVGRGTHRGRAWNRGPCDDPVSRGGRDVRGQGGDPARQASRSPTTPLPISPPPWPRHGSNLATASGTTTPPYRRNSREPPRAARRRAGGRDGHRATADARRRLPRPDQGGQRMSTFVIGRTDASRIFIRRSITQSRRDVETLVMSIALPSDSDGAIHGAVWWRVGPSRRLRQLRGARHHAAGGELWRLVDRRERRSRHARGNG